MMNLKKTYAKTSITLHIYLFVWILKKNVVSVFYEKNQNKDITNNQWFTVFVSWFVTKGPHYLQTKESIKDIR